MKANKIPLLLTLLLFINNISAQTYTENASISTTMLGLEKATAAWADYNNDGYLDVVYSGYIGGVTGSATYLFKSNGSAGTFTEEIYSGIEHLSSSKINWVDYNNDGNMDLFICGINYLNKGEAILYRNLGAAGNYTFVEVNGLNLNYGSRGSASWGDYNNDGLSDLLFNNGASFSLFKNNGNDIFSEETLIDFPKGRFGSSIWGDINNDGFLDAILIGMYHGSTHVYINNGPTVGYAFANTNDTIDGGTFGKMDLGDYDNDGDLDLIISANNSGGFFNGDIWIYENVNGNFKKQVDTAFRKILASNIQWADYDNDGDLDIITSGLSYAYGMAIFRNNGNNAFVEVVYPEINMSEVSYACWVDYNNDGMLDLFAIGEDSNQVRTTKIYDCSNILANQSPSAPINVSLDKSLPQWKLSWNASTDDKSTSLNYNIKVGTTANGVELSSPESDSISGFRKVFHRGLIQDTFCYIEPFVHGLSCDDLYISVQAIDQGGIGSGYSSIVDVNDWAISICSDTIILQGDTAQLYVADNSCNTTTYSWSPSVSLSNSNIKSPLAFPQMTTTYTVTVTDNGNIKVDSTVVLVNIMIEETASILNDKLLGHLCYSDFDNDDDLDLIAVGRENVYWKMFIYENDNGIYNKLNNIFLDTIYTGFEFQSIDFNNDGMMDFVSYKDVNNIKYALLYQNIGGFNFVKKDSFLIRGYVTNSREWIDINNDGFLDFIQLSSNGKIILYKNNNGLYFQEIEIIGFLNDNRAEFDLLDYDNDGFMDIALVYSYSEFPISIYRNINGEYFENTINLDTIKYGRIHSADLNNDGYSDIIISRISENDIVLTSLYINNTYGSFDYSSNSEVFEFGDRSNINTSDYDNDGDLDVFLSGYNIDGTYFSIYKNDGNAYFSKDESEDFKNMEFKDFRWLDYDNDGDLDLSMWTDNSLYRNHYFYNNISNISNNPPSAPANVAYDSINNKIVWNSSVDDISPTATLSYNIAVGSYIDSVNIGSPMANLSNGYRKTVGHGNIRNDTFAILNLPYDSTYYIRVQAIDQAFAGSQFSQVYQFTMSPLVYTSPDTTILCGGSANLSAAVVNGDTAGFTYTWSPAATLSTVSGINTIASPLQATWYKVMVTNANGYLHYDSIFVDIEPLTINVSDLALSCGDSSLVNTEINSSSSSIVYNWTPGIIFSDSTILNPMLYSDVPLNATLTANDNNCSDSKTIGITIAKANYNIDFTVDLANYTYTPFEVEFTNTTPNINNFNHEWIFGDNNSVSDNSNIVYHIYDNSGYYNVTLVATNPTNLCTDTITYNNLISCSVVGIQGQTNNVDDIFTIYPNPNKGSFYIEVKDANTEVQAVEIYSVMGKLVYYEGGNRFNNSSIINISATNLAKGLYFVKVTSDEKQYIVKIIRE